MIPVGYLKERGQHRAWKEFVVVAPQVASLDDDAVDERAVVAPTVGVTVAEVIVRKLSAVVVVVKQAIGTRVYVNFVVTAVAVVL